MTTNFHFIGLSYKNAPLEVREKVALSDKECKEFLFKAKEIIGVQELMVVSTCNRTEIYFVAQDNVTSESLVKLLLLEKGIFDIEKFLPFFIFSDDSHQNVAHLFRVSVGLESQVVGDLQISNQIKNAYQWSADANLSGPFIHRLMHTIFFTNKKIVQETNFRDGAASVSYASVELIEQLVAEKSNPKVLVVGLGEIGNDVCKNLVDSKIVEKVTLCNRTRSKAEILAQECGFDVLDFNSLWNEVDKYDVIVSSIVTDTPFFNLEKFKELEILTHKFLIDLSVPRSVDSNLESIPGILVYNVDQIKSTANQALEKRISSIPKVEEIIYSSLEEFNDWTQEMIVSPTIHKLKQTLEQIRFDEISRFTKQLSEEENKMIDHITKNMMQKIIKLPVLQLKAACKRGEAETLIDVLNDLFDLEKVKERKI